MFIFLFFFVFLFCWFCFGFSTLSVAQAFHTIMSSLGGSLSYFVTCKGTLRSTTNVWLHRFSLYFPAVCLWQIWPSWRQGAFGNGNINQQIKKQKLISPDISCLTNHMIWFSNWQFPETNNIQHICDFFSLNVDIFGSFLYFLKNTFFKIASIPGCIFGRPQIKYIYKLIKQDL